jgi:hypothetical protein
LLRLARNRNKSKDNLFQIPPVVVEIAPAFIAMLHLKHWGVNKSTLPLGKSASSSIEGVPALDFCQYLQAFVIMVQGRRR